MNLRESDPEVAVGGKRSGDRRSVEKEKDIKNVKETWLKA